FESKKPPKGGKKQPDDDLWALAANSLFQASLFSELDTTLHSDGNQDALQDDHTRTPSADPDHLQPTPHQADSEAEPGPLREGTQDQPRGLDALPPSGDAGQGAEPDRERSSGDRPLGIGDLSALGVSLGRQRNALRRSNTYAHPRSGPPH